MPWKRVARPWDPAHKRCGSAPVFCARDATLPVLEIAANGCRATPCVGCGLGGHLSMTPVTAQGTDASVLLGGLSWGHGRLGVPAGRPLPWETWRPASHRPEEGLCPGAAHWASRRWD